MEVEVNCCRVVETSIWMHEAPVQFPGSKLGSQRDFS